MQIKKEDIESLFERYPTTTHPLILRIAAMQFSHQEFQEIAIRFYHVIKHFPQFLAAIITNWDDNIGRMALVANLYEEHGKMRIEDVHLETYKHFLKQVGISQEALESSKPSPGVLAYVRAIKNLCLQQPYLEGLAALGVIEDIVHRVSPIISHVTKAEKQEIENVSHFAEHEVLDDQHSKEIYDMLVYTNQAEYEHIMQGLTLGAYYHNRLYTDILDEVVGKEMGQQPTAELPVLKTVAKGYPLQTGESGARRLHILNQLYNQNSLVFIDRFISTEKQRQLNILEVGCGAGELAYALAQRHSDSIQITGIDNSESQILLAKSKEALPNLDFVVDNVSRLAQKKMRFDIIYLRWVLIYQTPVAEFLKLLEQCLQKDGVLIIEDNSPIESGCRSLEQRDILAFWRYFWKQALVALGQEEDLEKFLVDTMAQYSFKIEAKALSQHVLRSPEQKEVFFLGIYEAMPRILEAGYPKEQLELFLKNLWSLRETKYPIDFVCNFLYAFKKQ